MRIDLEVLISFDLIISTSTRDSGYAQGETAIDSLIVQGTPRVAADYFDAQAESTH